MHKKYRNEFGQQRAEESLQMNWDVLYFVRQIILQTNVLQEVYSPDVSKTRGAAERPKTHFRRNPKQKQNGTIPQKGESLA